jgi:hypothetical protein
MKKLLLTASLFFSAPALATPQPGETLLAQAQTYPSFRYETPCALEANGEFLEDRCVVIETREKDGALRTRNIFSNRFGLTVKAWFDPEKGFMTWDSHNKFNYKWQYKIGRVVGMQGWSQVMPGFVVENVSWD